MSTTSGHLPLDASVIQAGGGFRLPTLNRSVLAGRAGGIWREFALHGLCSFLGAGCGFFRGVLRDLSSFLGDVFRPLRSGFTRVLGRFACRFSGLLRFLSRFFRILFGVGFLGERSCWDPNRCCTRSLYSSANFET